MDWQTYTAAGMVALTVLIFLVRLARRGGGGPSCGGGCGCSDKHKH
ncbi:MAG: hypothetical protein RLZ22_590 [Verrucomicrobiota bacterium]|jgi:hypothetical protein